MIIHWLAVYLVVCSLSIITLSVPFFQFSCSKLILWYVFWRPIFQPCDWELPLAGRGGYVTGDKINATISRVMSYQMTIIMIILDISMLYRITKILLHPQSITDPRFMMIRYNTMCRHHRRPFQILLIWNNTRMVRSFSFFSLLH